ncbi:calcium-binding protein [Nioella nitratireducens]|uniref:calcium-binding protein n=1 Tax=Nioella nitratireducens TaxID=1287720 RepID=UPI0008FD3CA3|nr:calcium-binding protein [Nioella nitratireducens]
MIAAGGVLLLMLVGFALEGLFSGDETDDTSNDGAEAPDGGSAQNAYDASVYTSDLHDLLFGSDGMGNPGDTGAPQDQADSGNILDDIFVNDPATGGGSDADPSFATTPIFGTGAADAMHGDTGNDEIHGADGNDDISGFDGDDDLYGDGGDDLIAGGTGDDTLAGGDGNDSLAGDTGSDTLDGGDGSDTLDGGPGDDLLILGDGDMAMGGDGEDQFLTRADVPDDVPILSDFMPGVDTILVRYDGDTPPEITFEENAENNSTAVFSDGAQILHLDDTTGLTLDDVQLEQEPTDPDGGDSITGSDGNDTLAGGDGSDTIDGQNGNDVLNGGTADDILRGREGMDDLFGQQDADALTGGAGDDLVDGGAQNDLAFGNEGDDTILGEGGNDELYGDQGDDSIEGGDGHDLLGGGDGTDTLSGGDGNDLIYGADGDDSLDGGAGEDFLSGGFGSDHMQGGDGNDTLDGTFAGGDDQFGPYDEDQADTMDGGAGDDYLFLGENDVATGGDGSDIFESGVYVENDSDAGLVTDFDPADDLIQVSVDLEVTPDPEISVVDFEDGSGASIMVDGHVVLRVVGAQGLDPTDIMLRDIRLDDMAETG